MASFKKLSKSDVTLVPYYANKQWNLSYCPYPTSSEYLTIYNGTNLTGSFLSDSDPVTEGQYDRLVYSQINQLFYQKYTTPLNTSSLVNSIYYESASQQRPTQSYFIYNDSARLVQNFPTGAMENIRVLAINQGLYGDKVLPNHFQLSSSVYNIIDDGYGNLFDGIITGSQQSTNIAYASSGVRLYSPGYDIEGNGTNIEWNTAYIGGSYTGTFWTNPTVANKTGRLNYTGLWSGKSVYYLGTGTLTFNISAASNTTYYFGIGCDNLASLYLDDNLIIAQSYPDGTGDNFRYWHIYPVSISSGSHTVKLLGENAGIPSPGNPGSMGIEIYNNTSTQISASITASPNGSSIPAGINLIYSSKDHLTEGNFDNQYGTHVGNLFYAHGLGVITNQDYQLMFPLPPIAKNDYGSFLTTDTKIISASSNDYARSGTLNTSSLAFSGSTSGDGYSWATGSNGTIVLTTTIAGTYSVYYTIGADIAGSCAVQLRSNKAKVTAVVTEPTTTTSTTTTTTTAPTTTTSTTTSTTTAPTTTTSTTTSTTTAPTTTTTTTSTTTSTTTAPPTTTTTTTSTTTTTTTACPSQQAQTIYYNYDTGLPVMFGTSSNNGACNLLVSSSTIYYTSSLALTNGTPLYYDECLTIPITASAYTTASQQYFRIGQYYINFETDRYTVRSVTACDANLSLQYQNFVVGSGNQQWEVEYSTGSFTNAVNIVTSNDVSAGAPSTTAVWDFGPLDITGSSPVPINIRVRKNTSTGNMGGNTNFGLYINDGTGYTLNSGFTFTILNNPIGTFTDITSNLSNPSIPNGYKVLLQITEGP